MRGKGNNKKETRDETAFAIWIAMLLIMFALAAIL